MTSHQALARLVGASLVGPMLWASFKDESRASGHVFAGMGGDEFEYVPVDFEWGT
jgi:hypothetical protein